MHLDGMKVHACRMREEGSCLVENPEVGMDMRFKTWESW